MVRGGRSKLTRAELAENLVVLGKSVDSVLAEDHLAVDNDVKNPTGARDERGVDVAVVLDRGGQTGRLGFVVSLHAIGDGDFHCDVAPLPGVGLWLR